MKKIDGLRLAAIGTFLEHAPVTEDNRIALATAKQLFEEVHNLKAQLAVAESYMSKASAKRFQEAKERL